MSPLTSENQLLQLLQQRYRARSPRLRRGIGDDAAVIQPGTGGEFWVVTTDMLVENIDFRREWTGARALGAKAVSVNLSDLAAMGARPRFFTVSLAFPRDIPLRWVLDLEAGLAARGKSLGAHLIGGDLSRADQAIVISVTALGESLNRRVLYRSGGKPGDLLYVTGVLGRSAAGLALLQRSGPAQWSRAKKEALQAHREPEPRCAAGLWLAQSGLVRCAMDLSDGLSMDLPRLCAACGTGAEVMVSQLPLFSESARWGCDPLQLALQGGEDFELLFAVPPRRSGTLEKTYPAAFPPITRIGRLIAEPGVWVIDPEGGRKRLPQSGFDHFTQSGAWPP